MARYYGEIFGTRDFMAQAAQQITGQLGKRLEHWSKHVHKQLERKAGMEELNYRLGADVRKAVIQRYKATRISRGKGYRSGDPGVRSRPLYRRFSDGAMLRTLQKPELITYDRNGLYLYDTDLLDKGAAQWYRLNFGAKPRGKASSGPKKPMNFFGVPTSTRVNLDRFGPSSSFYIPVGYWSSTKAARTQGAKLRKGNTAFYPAKLKPSPSSSVRLHRSKVQNRGIHGTGFLDQGLTVLNERYPKELEKLVRYWMDSSL